jgi:DNA-binding beta-propeller fold protein YncE
MHCRRSINVRIRPSLIFLMSTGLLGACSSTPFFAAWAPFGSSCPAGASFGGSTAVVGGQLRAPISLLDSSKRDAREVPVAGGDMAFADCKALLLPGIHATSAADGAYALGRAVAGFAYVVIARVKTTGGRFVTLRGLAQPGSDGATADINIATTVLTLFLTDGLSGLPGTFDPAQYKRAVALVYSHLVNEGSPDPADSTSIIAKVAAWAAVDPELKSLLDALRAALGKNQPPLDSLLAKIALLDHQAPPASPGIQGTSSTPSPSSGSSTPASPGSTATPSTAESIDPNAIVAVPDVIAPASAPVPVDVPSAPAGVQPSSTYLPGFLDGPLASARFNGLAGIAAAADGTIYAADTNNHRIRKIDFSNPAGPVVSTIAGNGAAGSHDGAGASALLDTPFDVALDGAGHLFILEYRANRIRMLDLNAPDQPVTTIAGSAGGQSGHIDGPGAMARFDAPIGIAIDPVGGRLYVVEATGAVVRAIDAYTTDHNVTTISGAYKQAGYRDGPAPQARFSAPQGVAVGPDRTLYIADTNNQCIRTISFDASGNPLAVATLTGRPAVTDPNAAVHPPSYQDGDLPSARFQEPVGLSFDANGDLLVADSLNRRIRRITLSKTPAMVTTAIGPTAQDAAGRTAALAFPAHITTDGHGNSTLSDLRLGLLVKLH